MGNNKYEENLRPDVVLRNNYSITFTTKEKWYKRIWNYISNQFTYIFCGKIRY